MSASNFHGRAVPCPREPPTTISVGLRPQASSTLSCGTHTHTHIVFHVLLRMQVSVGSIVCFLRRKSETVYAGGVYNSGSICIEYTYIYYTCHVCHCAYPQMVTMFISRRIFQANFLTQKCDLYFGKYGMYYFSTCSELVSCSMHADCILYIKPSVCKKNVLLSC